MSKLSLRFHPEAVAEAAASRTFYEEQAPGLGDAFAEELDHALSQITESPAAWPPYESGTRRYLLRRFPFFVVFRHFKDQIQVVAVMHAKRRPGYWKSR